MADVYGLALPALEGFSWTRAALALLAAVLLPLILHRIFYAKRVASDSSVGSGSLEDYMLKVRFDDSGFDPPATQLRCWLRSSMA